MEILLLATIVAILLFGSAFVRGVLGVFIAAAILIASLSFISIRFGLSVGSTILFFIGSLGLLVIAGLALPHLNIPNFKRYNSKQKKFLATIDEYHRLKDELSETKKQLLFEQVRGSDGDSNRIALLNAKIDKLETVLAGFN